MEKEYNWKAILSGSSFSSGAMIFVFMSNISINLKWFYLIIGVIAALGITYYFDKKKKNIFTSGFLVIIAALIIHGIKSLNIF